jgi:hypothetical protein
MAHYYIHKIEVMDTNGIDFKDLVKWCKVSSNHTQVSGAGVRFKLHRILCDPNFRLEAVG